MKDRIGTEYDADSLQKLFVYLGFYTNRYDDLTGAEMRRKLKVRGTSSGSVLDMIDLMNFYCSLPKKGPVSNIRSPPIIASISCKDLKFTPKSTHQIDLV